MQFLMSIPFAEKANGLRRVWHSVVERHDLKAVLTFEADARSLAPNLLQDMMLRLDPNGPGRKRGLRQLFDIGELIVSNVPTDDKTDDAFLRAARDTMMINPLGLKFCCAQCRKPCRSVPDRFGVYRNTDELGAVLFSALADREAISRLDFCSHRCVAKWTPPVVAAGARHYPGE